ncbi:hypothetical protein [Pseudomonas gingeri]
MGKPANVLFLPFPLIRNPYIPNSYLRLDAYERQFTIVCTGVLSLPEEAPHVGYYQLASEYVIGHGGLIEDAIVLCASRFYELHTFPRLGPVGSFDPRTVEIYYTGARAYKRGSATHDRADAERVLSGVVETSEIVWRRPCRTAEEVSAVEKRIAALLEQANEDIRGEAYDSARIARREARELKGFLISPRWRAFALQALINTSVTCCTA